MIRRIVGVVVILRCGHVLATERTPITWGMVRRGVTYCPYCEGDA